MSNRFPHIEIPQLDELRTFLSQQDPEKLKIIGQDWTEEDFQQMQIQGNALGLERTVEFLDEKRKAIEEDLRSLDDKSLDQPKTKSYIPLIMAYGKLDVDWKSYVKGYIGINKTDDLCYSLGVAERNKDLNLIEELTEAIKSIYSYEE